MDAPIFPVMLMATVIGLVVLAGIDAENENKELRKDTTTLSEMGFKYPRRIEESIYKVPFGSCKVKLTKNADGDWTYKQLIVSSWSELRNHAETLGLGYCF